MQQIKREKNFVMQQIKKDRKVVMQQIKRERNVGSDVIALFPSITADRSAGIIRDKIEESDIKFDSFDMKKGRAYIAINIEELDETQIQRLKYLIPTRASNKGIKPTMASIGKNWDPENQWVFQDTKNTEKEIKMVIGAVVEIAVKILFKNFTYKFGGKFYHQSEGGPIGVRATGAVAQLVMEAWAEQYMKILTDSGVLVQLLSGYVDDGRQVTSVLSPGMRFNKETKKFEFEKPAQIEDRRLVSWIK